MNDYRTSETDPHIREEYGQWGRILARGDARHGMLLVIVQKLCTTIHELEAAGEHGALGREHIVFFRSRLEKRVDDVLAVIRDNELGSLGLEDDFRHMRKRIAEARTEQDLLALCEPIHQLGHKTADALERAGGSAGAAST